ncbi:uncharacterized protein LOC134823039 isoform X2 [Bolinopsis microptera]|uniref:uncharacterized protein LOC134823039 isoform X2 n=1 Tax=Bolinopsis microptera TaxID=2820187 RepID=UPI003078D32D
MKNEHVWHAQKQECQTKEEAATWAFKCQVYNYTDLLNMAFICNRDDWHAASFVILYLLVSLTAMVSNASVVLASIVERWKEIDQFTFVFAVSLSFNHFLVAFLVYPMGVYTMLRTDGWGLGNYWCTFTAYCTSYFEVLYMMHVLMIVFDMLIYRFTNLKSVVKVYLVKKVAMSLWVTALIPHMILMWDQDWFLTDGGSLGISDKYLQCNVTGHDDPKPVINCFTAYTFTTYKELYIYLLCFFILPVAYAAISYTLLLYLRKRSMLKGNRKEELSEEDQLENARTFIQRYKASLCMVLVFSVTQLPKWICSFFLLGQDLAHRKKVNNGEAVEADNLQGPSEVIRMDFLSFWTCLGSILIPFCYMMTCPTYFHAVTATRPLLWLRKHGEIIHGRTYSKRLLERCTRLLSHVQRNLNTSSSRSNLDGSVINSSRDRSPSHRFSIFGRPKKDDSDSPKMRLKEPERSPTSPPNALDVPGQPRARLDTNSKIYMNSIAEECNGNEPESPHRLRLDTKSNVISNSEAVGMRPSSPADILVMLAAESEEEAPKLDYSPDIQPCGAGGTISSVRPISVTPQEHSTPRCDRPSYATLDESFPARPLRSQRNLKDLTVSAEEKVAAKRKLPVPRSSGPTSPALSQSLSTSSRL